MTKIN